MNLNETTLPTLSDMHLDLKTNPVAKKIKASIDKYKKLGMAEMVETAQVGAAAFVLSEFNINLLDVKPSYGDSRLDLVDIYGNRKVLEIDGSPLWKSCFLKDFTEPIPFPILEKIPEDWGGKAIVFYKREDPIIAIPIEKHNRLAYIEQRNEKLWKIGGYHAAVFQWE